MSGIINTLVRTRGGHFPVDFNERIRLEDRALETVARYNVIESGYLDDTTRLDLYRELLSTTPSASIDLVREKIRGYQEAIAQRIVKFENYDGVDGSDEPDDDEEAEGEDVMENEIDRFIIGYIAECELRLEKGESINFSDYLAGHPLS